MGGATVCANLTLPACRTTLTELLPVIQNLEDAVIGRVAEEAQAAGKPISCRAGCGACCRQMVPLSLFEAEALTEWMHSLPADRRAELAQRFHRALEALRDAGILDRILNDRWVVAEDRATQLAIDYFHARVACPFLENESCSIHPLRPLACREYLVVSPPALCQDPSVHDVTGVEMPIKFSTVLYAFGRQIEHDPRGWIPLVFLLAWSESGAKPGECLAGTGEEVFRQFLTGVEEVAQARRDSPQS
jgi:Fe-S-cluster containining protein